MKAVVIGTSGHYEYTFDSLKYGVNIVAIAPGHNSEDMSKCYEEYKKNGHYPRIYSDYILMLEIEKPDIAIVNSIMNFNCYISCECLKRNISVFSEKPLAGNLDDLNTLESEYNKAKAKNDNIVLACMFGISYEEPFLKLRKIMSSNLLGDIRLVQAQKSYKLGTREWYYSSKETYPGTIPWVSIHALDWIYGVCNLSFDEVYSIQSDKCNCENGSLEMSCISTFSNKDGQIAVCTSDYFRPECSKTHGDDRIRVVGTKGICEISKGRLTTISNDKSISSNGYKKISIFEDVVNEIRGKGKCYCNSDYSFNLTRVALKARESAEKKEVIKLI